MPAATMLAMNAISSRLKRIETTGLLWPVSTLCDSTSTKTTDGVSHAS